MKGGIWSALDRLAAGHRPAAVLAEWRALADGDFPMLGGFLRVTQRLAGDYPCLSEPDCGCRHELDQCDDARWVARCQCGVGDCAPAWLAPSDLIIHELDAQGFGSAVARVLGFGAAENAAVLYAAPKIWHVGTYTATRSPVYLGIFPSEAELFANVEGLVASRPEPFILLSPTAGLRSAAVDSFLARVHCGFVPLAPCVVRDGAWGLRVTSSIEPVLKRFVAELGRGTGLERTVEQFNRNLEAVAKGTYELRKENEELRRLQQEGFFKFALKVDGEDFRAFAIIMALGTRKAAADFLKVPHRSFYDRVEKWTARGKEYQRLYRFVEWRKKVGRKIMVPLGDSVQSGEPNDEAENPVTVEAVAEKLAAGDNRDYPAILREILEALAEQNPKNWAEVRGELMEMIRGEVGG